MSRCTKESAYGGRHEPQRGFTLLELIVTLFLLGLVLGLVIPSFSSLGQQQALAESKRIASILRYVNDTSVITREGCSLTFDLGARTLTYRLPEGEKTETFPSLSAVELSSKGRLSEGEVTLFLDHSGPRESVRVLLADEKKTVSVTLNHLSGRVKIAEEQ